MSSESESPIEVLRKDRITIIMVAWDLLYLHGFGNNYIIHLESDNLLSGQLLQPPLTT